MTVVVFLCLLTLPLSTSAQDFIRAKEAIHYVGQNKIVCGKIVSAKYARRSRGSPTFLNFDKAYPNHIFTAVIWIDDRANFARPPEIAYLYQEICVSGKIQTYKGRAQIFLASPNQVMTK
ncbi:MAG: DNA-binding protein [Deltaproteobacteria bacterium]|nr:DNA-binding protein [Deltaproteobacteria bacterium]